MISSIWNLFPEDNNRNNNVEIDTFQINLYCEKDLYKLKLVYINKDENIINTNEDKNKDKNLIQNEIDKIPKDFAESFTINNIKEINNKKIKELNNIHYKIVFIFEDILEMEEDLNYLIKLISKDNYRYQPFIIIISKEKKLELKLKIEEKFGNILTNINKKCYFDLNNIIILNNYNKVALSIIKIYLYFNQIDDYDFIDLINEYKLKNKNIEGITEKEKDDKNIKEIKEENDKSLIELKEKEEENDKNIKELIEKEEENDHFINIKLCGVSSVGKSTFINCILGEKRAMSECEAGTTIKTSIYISKKYHLKFIDDLGFNEGNEGKLNKELVNLNDKKHRIFIDENFKLSYSYNFDSRNKYHLLLYFFKYGGPYNIVYAHVPFITKIIKENIPIIYVINDCSDEIVKDISINNDDDKKDININNNEDNKGIYINNDDDNKDVSINNNDNNKTNKYEDLLDEFDYQFKDSLKKYIKKKEEGKNNKDNNDDIDLQKLKELASDENTIEPVIPINCLNKKGFHYLFDKIYNQFKAQFINEDDMKKLKNGENFRDSQSQIFDINSFKSNYIFYKNISNNDIISKQMKESVKLIKIVILKLTGQYSGALHPLKAFTFFFSRSWDYLRKHFFTLKRPDNEYYPELTDLVLTIHDIFGQETDEKECNDFIKECINEYFNKDNLEYKDFKKDILNYRNLYYNTSQSFEFDVEEELKNSFLEEKLSFEDNNFSKVGKFFLKQEKKFFNIEIGKATRIAIEVLNTNDKKIIDEDETIEDMNTNLINDKENDEEYANISMDKKEFNDILKKITNYLKKNFGEKHGENMVENSKDKILLKIFIVNLVSKKLLEKLCKKTQNIWAFFYNLARQYNDSIEGIKKLRDYFKE